MINTDEKGQDIVTVAVKIKLKEAEIVDFSLTDYAENLSDPIIGEGVFEFKTTLSFKLSDVTKILHTKVNIIINEKSTEEKLASIESHFNIEIENLDELTDEIDGKKSLPNHALYFIFASAISVAVASTRGMIISQTAGTKISKAIFPVFDPVRFIPEEIRESIKQ